MSINSNWPRWIYASVCKHFVPKFSPITVFIEGQQRGPTTDKDLVELRMDGPYFKEMSKDVWNIYVEVNALLQTVIRDTDIHVMHRNVGIVAAAFERQIPVLKYGSGIGDTSAQIGCLMLSKDARGRAPVQISHFGQVDPNVQLLQATVEGHYTMILED